MSAPMKPVELTVVDTNTAEWQGFHSHPCAHGVYVLEGTLDSQQGRFGAGSFANKEFGIHYVGDANDPDAPVAAG